MESRRVLLVDDSQLMRVANKFFLQKEGFQVTLACDGEEALQVARAEQPDIIIMDLLMPKMGGAQALRALKSDRLTTHIPVIVLSSLSSRNEAKIRNAGATAYFVKDSSTPSDLPRIVREVLGLIATQSPEGREGTSGPDIQIISNRTPSLGEQQLQQMLELNIDGNKLVQKLLSWFQSNRTLNKYQLAAISEHCIVRQISAPAEEGARNELPAQQLDIQNIPCADDKRITRQFSPHEVQSPDSWYPEI